jgi:hypothetical protein
LLSSDAANRRVNQATKIKAIPPINAIKAAAAKSTLMQITAAKVRAANGFL